VEKMKRMKTALKILAVLPCLFLLFSCDNILNKDQESDSLLIVAKISGQAADGSEADFYESDVRVINTAPPPAYFIYEDIATATLEAKLKEPESILGPSYTNNVLIYGYRISYETVLPGGIDPPDPFSGSLNVVIDIDATVDVTFILVRAAAKDLPPLDTLGGMNALLVDATITFYCKDLNGKPVKDAQGRDPSATISINFMDWADK
jgi:hypothetical protein